jgi:hydroxymethylpyrimidine pyrophosphatase-like HAD family hydrolase
VNGWFGPYDKLAMTQIFIRECLGIDRDAARERFAFVGDSPNDAPMFAFFDKSVGVANVRRFASLLGEQPKYVTRAASGAGFVELAEHLLRR